MMIMIMMIIMTNCNNKVINRGDSFRRREGGRSRHESPAHAPSGPGSHRGR